MIFKGIGSNWTKGPKNRAGYGVDLHVSGRGRHGKHLCLIFVRGEGKKQQRCDFVISGEDQLRAIACLIEWTIVSDADSIASVHPGDAPIHEIELAPAPLAHLSEDGAAHHLK